MPRREYRMLTAFSDEPHSPHSPNKIHWMKYMNMFVVGSLPWTNKMLLFKAPPSRDLLAESGLKIFRNEYPSVL
jgi:hypothetical protein